jgi:hypothetical protein
MLSSGDGLKLSPLNILFLEISSGDSIRKIRHLFIGGLSVYWTLPASSGNVQTDVSCFVWWSWRACGVVNLLDSSADAMECRLLVMCTAWALANLAFEVLNQQSLGDGCQVDQ